MKSLIRFEDTYGLTDIFCARNNIKYIDIERKQERMIEISPELFIDFGLASGWGTMSNNEAYDMMEHGIERVIFVYDLDNLNGDKAHLLSKEDLVRRINNIRNKFQDIGYNIEICFIPVVYAAETLMLYQFLSESDNEYGRIYRLVNTTDTNLLHLHILAYMIGAKNYKRAKKIRDFLDISKLVKEFYKVKEDDPNNMIKSWIINGCDVEYKDLFSGKQALDSLDRIIQQFELWKKQNCAKIFTIDGAEITLNDILINLLRNSEKLSSIEKFLEVCQLTRLTQEVNDTHLFQKEATYSNIF